MLGPEVWSPEAQWYVLGYVKFTRDINTKAQTGCPTAAGGCGRPREAAGGCGRLREAGCKQCHWRWGRGLQIGLRAGRGTLGAAAPVAVASWRRWPALGAAAPGATATLAWRWALQRQPKLWRLMERGATGVELPPNPGLVPGRVRCGGGEGGTGDNHAMVMPLVNLAMLSFQLAPRVSTAFDTCRSRTCEGRPSMVERTLGERLRTEFDSMMVEVALERKANLVEVSMTNSNAPAVHPLFLNRTDPTRAV